MRTEIADFLSPGMKAPARAGLDRAKEPRERFVLPSEPADRSAARATPASRSDAPPARGREDQAGNGVDPATVAAARALERAAPQSALRRGDESAPTEGTPAEATPVVEGGAQAEPISPEAALEAALDLSDEAAGDAAGPAQAVPAAESVAAESAPDGAAPVDPTLADQAGSPPLLETPAASAPPPASDDAATEEISEDGAKADASELASSAHGDDADAAPPMIVAPSPPAVADSTEAANETTEDAVDGKAAATERPDSPAAAANAAVIRDVARDKPVDGLTVAEAARALRGAAAPDAQTAGAASSTQPEDEAGPEADAAPPEQGENGRTASNEAGPISDVDLEDMRARQAANGAAERGVGLFGPGAGVTDVSEPGADAAIRALQQAASSQSAALQAEAAGAAETGRPTIVVPQTALAAVPMAIGIKALNGVNNFQIRLDPAELGRIDVSLEIDGEGNVNAKLVVERVETLQLLQRDARTLERAFEQAGLKPSEGGIDLSLRDSGGERRSGREGSDEPRGNAYGRAGGSGDETVAVDPRAPAALAAQAALRRALGGVDVRI